MYTPPGWEHRVGTTSNAVFTCDDIEAKHRVDTRQPLHRLGILGRHDLPLGAFQAGVARRQHQGDLAVPAIEDQVGMRRLDPTQVMELVVLAWDDEAPGLWCPLEDSHGPMTDPI